MFFFISKAALDLRKYSKSYSNSILKLIKKHSLHKKWSFPLRISSVNVTTADLVWFTEEILNGKLHFLCSDYNLESGLYCHHFCVCLWVHEFLFHFITIFLKTNYIVIKPHPNNTSNPLNAWCPLRAIHTQNKPAAKGCRSF